MKTDDIIKEQQCLHRVYFGPLFWAILDFNTRDRCSFPVSNLKSLFFKNHDHPQTLTTWLLL